MSKVNTESPFPSLQTLPNDDVRATMWRYADRFDIQMMVQASRSVARGPVARLVAQGARNSHEWTPEKNTLLKVYDESGITAAGIDAEYGGFLSGPKNLVLSLIAFELAWVDAGASTASLASNLGLAPIHERGTEDQRKTYMGACCPKDGAPPRRAAFALTEPIPYVGVDTNTLHGKVKIARWDEGKEPVLKVDKRGRFITNMAFADIVTAAVASDDPRIKSSCLIILESTDPGTFDPGTPTKKLVHQLSATSDPVFSLEVPASRIVGGYTVQDGVIVPNYTHSEVIEAVFRRTRVAVGLMTAAKLLSAVEPVIRYQRQRFRGGESVQPGSPRFELGLQQREDSLHRLVDVWAIGEAAASLGFRTSRLFDELDPLDREKDALLAERGIKGARATMKVFRDVEPEAREYIALLSLPEAKRDQARFAELDSQTLVKYSVLDAQANVLCPATKLWNTGVGATFMREAVSLMGGYGITEDCPGFLPLKWMDAQLEATYEGPEAVQRRQMSVTMGHELFLAQYRHWAGQMRRIAVERPGTGACTLSSAMDLWLWTHRYLSNAKDANGQSLMHGQRQGVAFPLADALCWLLASREFIMDVMELEAKGPENPALAEGLAGTASFMNDLSHVMAARAAGEVGRICAELVYGYNRHPAWDDPQSCFCEEELREIEGVIAGFEGEAEARGEEQGIRAAKAGPCARAVGLETFQRLRVKLDGCLTGSRLAKDRAAQSLVQVMIPEALDYPQ